MGLHGELARLVGSGNVEGLRAFLREHSSSRFLDINRVNGDGTTPLSYCVRVGAAQASGPDTLAPFLACVRVLVEHGASTDRQDKQGWAPLHWAVFHDCRPLVEELLALGASPELRDGQGRTPLHKAAAEARMDCLKPLVAGCNSQLVDVPSQSGIQPLIYAVELGHYDVCKVLLSLGADPNAQERDPPARTALHFALRNHFIDIFSLLVKHGARPDKPDTQGRSVVHKAATHTDPTYLLTICLHCPDMAAVETPNEEGATPLMLACQRELPDHVRSLLEREVDVLAKDNTGKTALHYCVENRQSEISKLVAGADAAVLDVRDDDGYTALHLSVIAGNSPVITELLNAGADVHATDQEGHTAVHWATVCGHLDVIDQLESKGADLAVPDNHHAYPLHYSAQMCGGGNEGADPKLGIKMLNKLLQKKVPVNCEDKDLRQPLLWAASSGSAEACQILLQAGAPVEAVDKDGLTALHCAASRGHTQCAEVLLKKGAKVNSEDKNGCTPLFYAITLGHMECTKLLLKHKANPSHQDHRGRSPAHCAAAKGSKESLGFLRTQKGNLNLPNSRGEMPIHEACLAKQNETVEYLLDRLGDRNLVNSTNVDGRTCLHIAALTNNLPLCEILMAKGADRKALMKGKDKQITPYDAAVLKGHSQCAEYLKVSEEEEKKNDKDKKKENDEKEEKVDQKDEEEKDENDKEAEDEEEKEKSEKSDDDEEGQEDEKDGNASEHESDGSSDEEKEGEQKEDEETGDQGKPKTVIQTGNNGAAKGSANKKKTAGNKKEGKNKSNKNKGNETSSGRKSSAKNETSTKEDSASKGNSNGSKQGSGKGDSKQDNGKKDNSEVKKGNKLKEVPSKQNSKKDNEKSKDNKQVKRNGHKDGNSKNKPASNSSQESDKLRKSSTTSSEKNSSGSASKHKSSDSSNSDENDNFYDSDPEENPNSASHKRSKSSVAESGKEPIKDKGSDEVNGNLADDEDDDNEESNEKTNNCEKGEGNDEKDNEESPKGTKHQDKDVQGNDDNGNQASTISGAGKKQSPKQGPQQSKSSSKPERKNSKGGKVNDSNVNNAETSKGSNEKKGTKSSHVEDGRVNGDQGKERPVTKQSKRENTSVNQERKEKTTMQREKSNVPHPPPQREKTSVQKNKSADKTMQRERTQVQKEKTTVAPTSGSAHSPRWADSRRPRSGSDDADRRPKTTMHAQRTALVYSAPLARPQTQPAQTHEEARKKQNKSSQEEKHPGFQRAKTQYQPRQKEESHGRGRPPTRRVRMKPKNKLRNEIQELVRIFNAKTLAMNEIHRTRKLTLFHSYRGGMSEKKLTHKLTENYNKTSQEKTEGKFEKVSDWEKYLQDVLAQANADEKTVGTRQYMDRDGDSDMEGDSYDMSWYQESEGKSPSDDSHLYPPCEHHIHHERKPLKSPRTGAASQPSDDQSSPRPPKQEKAHLIYGDPRGRRSRDAEKLRKLKLAYEYPLPPDLLEPHLLATESPQRSHSTPRSTDDKSSAQRSVDSSQKSESLPKLNPSGHNQHTAQKSKSYSENSGPPSRPKRAKTTLDSQDGNRSRRVYGYIGPRWRQQEIDINFMLSAFQYPEKFRPYYQVHRQNKNSSSTGNIPKGPVHKAQRSTENRPKRLHTSSDHEMMCCKESFGNKNGKGGRGSHKPLETVTEKDGVDQEKMKSSPVPDTCFDTIRGDSVKVHALHKDRTECEESELSNGEITGQTSLRERLPLQQRKIVNLNESNDCVASENVSASENEESKSRNCRGHHSAHLQECGLSTERKGGAHIHIDYDRKSEGKNNVFHDSSKTDLQKENERSSSQTVRKKSME